MIAIGSVIKKADVLSNNSISFISSKDNKKTVIGGICNIILIVIFIFLNYRLVFKYFSKVDPFLSYVTENNNEREELIINNNNFPLAIALLDVNSKVMSNEGYFYLTIEFVVWNYTDRAYRSSEQIDCNLCGNKLNNILRDDQISLKYIAPKLYCADLDNRKIVGNPNSNKISFINVLINQCKSGFTHKVTKEKCPDLTDEQIEEEVNKVYMFGINYPSYLISNNDLKNPFHFYFHFDLSVLDLKNFYTINYYFEQSIMESDNVGIFDLFTSKKQENRAIYINTIERKNNDIKPYSDTVMRYTFFQSNTKTVYNRRFMSLEELLGSVGGISQIVLIIIDSIVSIYSKNCFSLTLLKLNKKLDLDLHTETRTKDLKNNKNIMIQNNTISPLDNSNLNNMNAYSNSNNNLKSYNNIRETNNFMSDSKQIINNDEKEKENDKFNFTFSKANTNVKNLKCNVDLKPINIHFVQKNNYIKNDDGSNFINSTSSPKKDSKLISEANDINYFRNKDNYGIVNKNINNNTVNIVNNRHIVPNINLSNDTLNINCSNSNGCSFQNKFDEKLEILLNKMSKLNGLRNADKTLSPNDHSLYINSDKNVEWLYLKILLMRIYNFISCGKSRISCYIKEYKNQKTKLEKKLDIKCYFDILMNDEIYKMLLLNKDQRSIVNKIVSS